MTELQQDLASLRLPSSGALSSKRARRWPWIAIVLAIAIAYGAWRTMTGAVEIESARPVIETAGAAPAGSAVLTAAGYVVARRRAVVSAKIQGRLAVLRVEEGARVRDGEVFARLESADFEAALSRSKAALGSAQAQVASAEAGVTSADAQIARTEADLAEARRQSGVTERLAREEIATTDQNDAARSRVRVAEAVVGQAKADAGRARAELARTFAAREQARADVAFNDAQLQNTYIRAPFTGTVVKKMAEVGESVAPIPPGVNISTASGAIVALADLDTLEVEVDVAEANVARLGDSQPADVTVEAFPDRKYRGVLRQIIPTADRTRATVTVKVTILDKDANLKPEMSAKVTFLAPDRPAASRGAEAGARVVFVPQSAVITRDGKTNVFVIADGRAAQRGVTLGPRRNDQVAIVKGLAGTETLVARPPASLKDGARVRVKDA